MTENSDPYLYVGTKILKNLRGLTDPKKLARFEGRRTHRRIAELIDTPVLGSFDIAHLKVIHRYILQDVYEWTGQFRTVNISKGGHLFGIAAFLDRRRSRPWGDSRSRTTSLTWMLRCLPTARPIFSAS